MRILLLLLVLLGLIGIVGIAHSLNDTDTETHFTPPPKQIDNSPMQKMDELVKTVNTGRAIEGAKLLKEAMRNPDSFTIKSALVMDSGAVCYEYRSQNGFGGMNREQAVLTPKDRILLQETSGFYRAWEKFCHGKSGDDAEALINVGSL